MEQMPPSRRTAAERFSRRARDMWSEHAPLSTRTRFVEHAPLSRREWVVTVTRSWAIGARRDATPPQTRHARRLPERTLMPMLSSDHGVVA